MANVDTAERQPLPLELHAATRVEHMNLNRTIIARLPLCLPQAASSPNLYLQGMTAFSQIYYAFEEAWDTLLSEDELNQDQRDILTRLNLPQLRRTERLRKSLAHIGKSADPISRSQLFSVKAATLPLHTKIKSAIVAKPHLLLAYTWTMYLALFNGGRWIAKQLLNPGPEFWSEPDRASIVSNSLSFWFFGDDEDYDGEDLKIAFKDRFNDASEKLTDTQRAEVIHETKRLFQICNEMIEVVDGLVQEQMKQQEEQIHPQHKSSSASIRLQHTSSSQSYLAFFTPRSVLSLWHSIANILPSTTQSSLLLRREIEQKP